MSQATNLVRTYPRQAASDQDAQRLARLGYVVLEVSEQEKPQEWAERLLERFVPAVRLVVTYSD